MRELRLGCRNSLKCRRTAGAGTDYATTRSAGTRHHHHGHDRRHRIYLPPHVTIQCRECLIGRSRAAATTRPDLAHLGGLTPDACFLHNGGTNSADGHARMGEDTMLQQPGAFLDRRGVAVRRPHRDAHAGRRDRRVIRQVGAMRRSSPIELGCDAIIAIWRFFPGVRVPGEGGRPPAVNLKQIAQAG